MDILRSLLATSIGNITTITNSVSDNVFSAAPYVGKGYSSGIGDGSPVTVVNGIDLQNSPGFVWLRDRDGGNHWITTTFGKAANTSEQVNTGSSGLAPVIASLNNNGFTVGNGTSNNYALSNALNHRYMSWSFRNAAKFFHTFQYIGNGAANRVISHSLGSAPGMAIVHGSAGGDWMVNHIGSPSDLYLNLTSNATGSYTNIIAMSATTITVNSSANTNGVTYTAFLFGYNTGVNGLIECGSYLGGGGEVNIGWEPQFLLLKNRSGPYNWRLIDNVRGLSANTNTTYPVFPNSSVAETVEDDALLTARGFIPGTNMNISTDTYIYLAVRRPTKLPTSGTEVFAPVARTGTGNATSINTLPFSPDLIWTKNRGLGAGGFVGSRLRTNVSFIRTDLTNGEVTTYFGGLTTLDQNGYSLGPDTASGGLINGNGNNYIDWVFKRAPNFMDEVTYTGDGTNNKVIPHSLGSIPEFILTKRRSGNTRWQVYHSGLGTGSYCALNSNNAVANSSSMWGSQAPTVNDFAVGDIGDNNISGASYAAVLFSTLPGVSKVGLYTGDGTASKLISCGFSNGARFILIKRTDSTGEWYIWDSARGITVTNEPHLAANLTAAEISDDSVDPAAAGFIVNSGGVGLNVSGATYIFLAIA